MIAAIYAGLSGLMLVYLSISVIKTRMAAQIAFGDQQHRPLQQRCRAHGNFIEYTPIFLLLLVLAEMHQLSVYAVHMLGLMFLAGRISHAYSLIHVETLTESGAVEGSITFRQAGMVLSFMAIIIASLSLLWLVISARGVF